jgi:hypothetical protein
MYLFRIYFSYCPAQSKTHIHHLLLSLLFPFTTAISVDLRHDNQLAIVAPAPDILRRKYKPHAYPHILPFFRSRHSIFTTKTFFHQNFSSPQHKVLFTLTMDAFLFWCFLAALLGWLAVEMMHDPLVPIRAPAPNPPAPTTTTSNPLPPRAVRRALTNRPLAAKPFSFVPVSHPGNADAPPALERRQNPRWTGCVIGRCGALCLVTSTASSFFSTPPRQAETVGAGDLGWLRLHADTAGEPAGVPGAVWRAGAANALCSSGAADAFRRPV